MRYRKRAELVTPEDALVKAKSVKTNIARYEMLKIIAGYTYFSEAQKADEKTQIPEYMKSTNTKNK